MFKGSPLALAESLFASARAGGMQRGGNHRKAALKFRYSFGDMFTVALKTRVK